MLAALYEWWPDPALEGEDRWLLTSTVITRPATDALGHVHDRSPVVVPTAMVDAWLDVDLTGREDVRALLAGVPDPELVPRPVGPAVGNVRAQGSGLIGAV